MRQVDRFILPRTTEAVMLICLAFDHAQTLGQRVAPLSTVSPHAVLNTASPWGRGSAGSRARPTISGVIVFNDPATLIATIRAVGPMAQSRRKRLLQPGQDLHSGIRP